MSSDLVQEMLAVRPSDLARCPDSVTQSLIDTFTQRFVGDRNSTWWWDSLKVTADYHNYGSADGIAAMVSIARAWGPSFLLVTDEMPAPTECIIGLPDVILSALGQVRNFEFVMSSFDMTSWIFDTHQNGFLYYRGEQLTIPR